MKLILAITKTGGIAKEGKIPWNITDETLFFKNMTIGGVVIMGRKTFDSIGKKLPKRENIIIGKDHTSIQDAISQGIEFEKQGLNVWVIGGSEIAEAFQNYVTEAFLSVIHDDYECDLFAPQFVLETLNTIHRLYDNGKEGTGIKDICAPKMYSKCKDYTIYQCFFQKNNEEIKFQNLIEKIVNEGTETKLDRTQFGTRSVFGEQLKFSLENGKFPMSTLRSCFFRGIFEELMWFLRGQTDSNILSQKGISIWEGNSSRESLDKLNLTHREVGDCGSIYGFQWRHWGAKYIDCKTDYTGKGIDQISNLIHEIKTNPFSRRLLISGWNVEDLDQMCLPPCHTFYQFNVETATDGGKNFLSCHYYQRSSDILLAGHWNITSASLLTILLSYICDLRPKSLTVSYGNVHIYNNHKFGIPEYLYRFPFEYPTISLNPKTPRENIWDFEFGDIQIQNYNRHPNICFEMNS